MKNRKFGLNILETLRPSRPVQEIEPEKPPARILLEQHSPPPTPYEGRRSPLPAVVEIELRMACRDVATNTIPSDAYIEPDNFEAQLLDDEPHALPAIQPPLPTLDVLARPQTPGRKFRNFSMPASDLVEFPLPNALNRTREVHPPSEAIIDFRAPIVSLSNRRERSRRRDSSLSDVDRASARTSAYASARTSVGPAPAMSFSAVQSAYKNLRLSNGYDFDTSTISGEDMARVAHTTTTISAGNSKHASYHEPIARKDDSGAESDGERGRQRRSWYRVFAGLADNRAEAPILELSPAMPAEQAGQETEQAEGQEQEQRVAPSRIGRSQSRARSIRERLRPASRRGRTPQMSGAPSREASRDRTELRRGSSAASSMHPAVPPSPSRFNWNKLRHLGSSKKATKEESDEVEAPPRPRIRRSASMQSLRNRLSMNLKELPPMPSITWFNGGSNDGSQVSTNKLHRISAIWNKSGGEVKSEEAVATEEQKASWRRSMDVRPSTAYANAKEVQKKLQYRRSYSDLQTSQQMRRMQNMGRLENIADEVESPVLPHIMVRIPAIQNRVLELPAMPAQKLDGTPTDSVMEGQDSDATPLSTTVALSIKDVPSPPPTDPLPPPPRPLQQHPPTLSNLMPRPAPLESAAPARAAPLPPPPALSSSVPNVPITLEDSATAAASKISPRRSSYSWLPVDHNPTPPRTLPQRDVPTYNSQGQRIARITADYRPQHGLSVSTEVAERQASVVSAKSTRSVDLYNSLQAPQYHFAEDITLLAGSRPTTPNETATKKRTRMPWVQKKPSTWMDEMEKLKVKKGMLMVDQLNGPPIVRY